MSSSWKLLSILPIFPGAQHTEQGLRGKFISKYNFLGYESHIPIFKDASIKSDWVTFSP